MVREWAKISMTPSVVQHTWDDASDTTVTQVKPGTWILYEEGKRCLTFFHGASKTCECGAMDLMGFQHTPSEYFDPTPFGA